ncbi:30S ribosomal protein S17 [Candidatus Karelsulcia muelleri]|uniref:30S ribosomal protein S17 n=1 Tax=Candidatus Karelsulcia muelleri TaxID=336810 RepID=UPI0023640F44|nr:30S ribosomal protein S17 [Candidatus Karelsulcia muelleri]WDE42252.1 30S ribosomal protein S17 [Candidatus Karelsulcia muelleri]WDR79100.1 30S ribosomal protein S17 [Candidatus Karelsulcia muelleri]
MRKQKLGVILSEKMNKTRVVGEVVKRKHKIYKKNIYYTRKYLVHDEQNKSNTGDTVEIIFTRPLSKNKRWNFLKIIKTNVTTRINS